MSMTGHQGGHEVKSHEPANQGVASTMGIRNDRGSAGALLSVMHGLEATPSRIGTNI